MWKGLFIASFLGTVFLAGCNTDDTNTNGTLNNETPMQELREGVDDVIDNNNNYYNDRNDSLKNETVNPVNPDNNVNDGMNNNGVNNGVNNNGTTNNGVNETTTEKFTSPNGTVEESTTIDKNKNNNRVVE